jgi:ERCC4-type nuclease
MIIEIDVREKALIALIQDCLESNNLQTKHSIVVKAIDLGDVVLYNSSNETDPVVIIERKSLPDLASSIRDGRYNEQSLRLHHTKTHNHNIWYLIEGSMKYYNSKYTKVEAKALYSSMVSLNYYKGFSIFRTFDIQETAEFIVRCVDKISREAKLMPYFSNATCETPRVSCQNQVLEKNTGEKSILNTTIDKIITSIEPDTKMDSPTYKLDIPYSNTVKKVKKDNLTPENIGEVILSQIPGISNITSLAIMKSFGSLYNLMTSLSKDRHCLDSFKYTTSSGQVRKLSSSAIQNIVTYLLYQKESIIHIT